MVVTDRALHARGKIDSCHPESGAGTVAGRAVLLPGWRVRITGWAYEHGSGLPVVSAAVGPLRVPFVAGFERLDVVPLHGISARNTGFEGAIEGLDDLSGPFDLQVMVRFGGDPERQVGPTFQFVTCSQTLPTIPNTSELHPSGRIRRLIDTRPEPLPPGWTGRRSIRPGAAIDVAGWALDVAGEAPQEFAVEIAGRGKRAAFSAQTVFDGEATRKAGPDAWFAAGFQCVIDPAPFPPGLYDATILVKSHDGVWRRGPSAAFQIAPTVAEIAPKFLPDALEAAECAIDRLEPLDAIRGEPIAIEGWAIDPATKRGGPVFVAFDDGHPLPIPSTIARPDLRAAGDDAIGFAGIADTAGAQPGTHRLRIQMLAASGALWHVLAERDVRIR